MTTQLGLKSLPLCFPTEPASKQCKEYAKVKGAWLCVTAKGREDEMMEGGCAQGQWCAGKSLTTGLPATNHKSKPPDLWYAPVSTV